MDSVEHQFTSFFSKFTDRFKVVKFSYRQHAFDYFQSVFKFEKKKANCQYMADHLSNLSQQSINHFVNSDLWSYRALMDQVVLASSDLFSQRNDPTALLIDEVGFRKKGEMSACVSRQHLGCIGKMDNGQVAVAAGLSQSEYYTPIDIRLFMPKEWKSDTVRGIKCNIPEKEHHLSKPEIAKKIIEHVVNKGIKFDYVNFDALYGIASSLLEYLVDRQLDFIGDIRSDQQMYFNYDLKEKCRVDKYIASLSEDEFQQIDIRKSTKGTLRAKFHYVKIQTRTTNHRWLYLILLVRKDADGKTKYSVTNMENNHIKKLAQKQRQRIFIEQIFKEDKNLVGMGDYQIRGLHGFHNHMAMLLITKLKFKNNKQKFTAATIKKIVNLCIKTKIEEPQLAIDLIFEQHQKYINQLLRNQKKTKNLR
nr:IS701 family transposase [Aquimarina sp. AD1]